MLLGLGGVLEQTKINSKLLEISMIWKLPDALSFLSPQNLCLKFFRYFFTKIPTPKKFLIFSLKSFSNFHEMELSYILLKKVFLIF